jgi:hypothetical protein
MLSLLYYDDVGRRVTGEPEKIEAFIERWRRSGGAERARQFRKTNTIWSGQQNKSLCLHSVD